MSDPVDPLEALAREPYRFDFFQALRLIEQKSRDKPRIGQAQRAHEDPVRLGQEASLAFSPSTLSAFEPANGDRLPRLLVSFFGLLGPNGPMPLHFTEYARDRVHNSDDTTLVRFLDIFHHRLLSLFYRAWASAQPVVSLDREADDRFTDYLGSLFGVGTPALRDRDALPDTAKIHYAGLLANLARPADGLRSILSDFLRLPVRIVEFVAHWLELPEEEWTRLSSHEGTNQLGVSTVLGASVLSRQHKFRVVIGPMDREDFTRLLPGGESLRQVASWIRLYAGDVPAWELQMLLEEAEVPSLELGRGCRLGWTTWLPGRRVSADADDLVLHPA